MSTKSSSFLLLSYIICETVRASFAYHVFHTLPTLSPSLIALLSEFLKLIIAFVLLLAPCTRNSTFLKASQYWTWIRNHGFTYALPAALYLINNLIYMSALPLTSPSLLQVCVLAKLPATGILHHFVVRRQENLFAWTSLLFLCVGLVIFNIPTDTEQTSAVSGWYIAPIAGGVIAILSAIASINTENLLKDGNLWMAQTCLYTWGVVFSILSFPVTEFFGSDISSSHDLANSALIPAGILVCITAGNGLLVAALLKYRDNIIKVIGTSASLVAIVASQYLLYPQLRASTYTPSKVCGGSIVSVSAWCYNHWNEALWPPSTSGAYSRLDSESGESLSPEEFSEHGGVRSQEKETATLPTTTSVFDPTATKIMCCALIIGFITMEMSWHPNVH